MRERTGAAAPSGASSARERADRYLVPLLDPELARLTHEQAAQKLAPKLALTVVTPLPGSLTLVSQSESARVQLDYLPDANGGWAFADAIVELRSESAAKAKAEYAETAALLKRRLGAPEWEKADAAYPASGYSLGSELAVSLGAVAAPDQPAQLAFSIARRSQ